MTVTPDPWTFGEAPLDQTTELAALLRRVTGLALSMEAADPRVAQLIDSLAAAERSLAEVVPPSPVPRVGAAVDGDGRVYLDHSRAIGAYNPCVPTYAIAVDGPTATGTVAFPVAYEGPPGVVHGGFLAVFFDCAIQHHNCDVGVAGKTTNLELRYRRPAPLHTELTFEIDRVVTGDRIESTARLRDGDRLCAEAVMRALAGDRANLPAVSPRRAS